MKNSFSESKFLKSIITDEAVVVDIGSNVGSFIKQILNTNKKTHVYSIEPNKELIKFQKISLEIEKILNFIILQLTQKMGLEFFM